MAKKSFELDYATINAGLVIILIVVLAAGLYVSTSIGKPPKAAEELNVTAQKTANVQLTLLTASNCAQCFDITQVTSALGQMGVNITEQKSVDGLSDEGKALTGKYNISKLPAAVITGEIDALKDMPLRQVEGAIVFDQVPAPYVDVATGKIKGLVMIISLEDPGCKQCNNASLLVEQLKSSGMVFEDEKALMIDSDEAKRLIAAYEITKVPTIILSEDALDYDFIAQVWDQAGTKEDDGRLVLRLVPPPYHDLSSNKVAGLVALTFLADKSCTECYDVNMHEEILKGNFRMQFSGKKTVDIADDAGKTLVSKYNITKVPTVLMSAEASVYPGISQVWSQVGTVESDGVYVFRSIDLLQDAAYKDLATGTVVKPLTEVEATEPTEAAPTNSTV